MMSMDDRASVFWTSQWNPGPLGLMEDGLPRDSVLELIAIEACIVCVQCPEGCEAGDNDG